MSEVNKPNQHSEAEFQILPGFDGQNHQFSKDTFYISFLIY